MEINGYVDRLFAMIQETGSNLSMIELNSVIRDEFSRHSEDGIEDVIQSDYDILEELEPYFGIMTEQEIARSMVLPRFAGLCCAGHVADSYMEAADEYRWEGRPEVADVVINKICGRIFFYISSIVETLYLCDAVNETAARRLVRFIWGHEHRHAHQSPEMLATTDAAAGMALVENGELSSETYEVYANAPLEVDADRAGFEHMMSFE